MSPDVFIVHSGEDVDWLKRLSQMLAPLIEAGLSCWDETQLAPGRDRKAEFSAALSGASVVVLLVSPAFLASELMDDPQLSQLLATAHEKGVPRIFWIPLIPCLWNQTALAAYEPLHDAAKPLSTLSDADTALAAICERIRQAAGIPVVAKRPSRKNPYRGLSAFQVEEAHLFFGREALTEQLLQRFKSLWEQPGATCLLTIIGPSGSGKSSVARAGLLAALQRSPMPGPRPMRLIIVKPGERPIESLARELVPLLPSDSSVLPAQRQVAIEQLLTDKKISSEGLRRFAADLPEIAASPLIVLVDQCEELYTLCKDPEERDAFVEILLHAASESSRMVSIILTLRSDFLGETQRHHNQLNRLIAAQGMLVPALSPDELRDAIARPAEHAGHPIDPATIELLLTETRGNQGALPLLEFALTRIWEGIQRGQEPSATLLQLGGVGGALAGEAQKIYDALSKSEQGTARRALVRLVRPGEGARDTRRRAPISELCGRAETDGTVLSVLRRFALENARLITLSGEGAQTLAEVTHEALFDHWAALRSWIHQGRQDRWLHDRALEAAKLWDQAGRPAGRLWRPPDLDLLRAYQQRKPEEFGALLVAFLTAAERRQRRERAMSLGAVAAVVSVLLIAAGVYIVKQRELTDKERLRTQEASAAKEDLHQQLLDSYIERGRRFLFEERRDPGLGLLWLHRAQEEGSKDSALPNLLNSALQSAGAPKVSLMGHTDLVRSATYSPDGRRIVTASVDKTARVWNADSGRLVAELKGHTDTVSDAAYSPDGRRIITASEDKTARVWDAENGRLVAELKGHEKGVWSATYSPDGRRILTASHDDTARVWDAESGELIVNLKGHPHGLNSATYSPDGRRIVTTSPGRKAQVWNAESGRRVAELKGPEGHALSATYSPDGRRIVTASADKTARVWDAESGRLVVELKGHESHVLSATYSPDGRRIVTASADKTARVWDAESGELVVELRGHRNTLDSAIYSPDGRRIVTRCEDNTVRVWDAESGELFAELDGHKEYISSATYSPDGLRILTASADRTARVWGAESGRLVAELKDHGDVVSRATYSPDGRRIVTASADKTARVWDVGSGRLVAELKGHGSAVWRAMYSPDGRRIVTASADKTARVWDAESGRLVTELKGHRESVWRAMYSPDGRRIVTASEDHTARVWDAENGRLVAELKGHGNKVLSATYSPDGRRIVTASEDKTARVWDAESGRPVSELKGHGELVYSATYSPDGRRIVTASEDRTARVWDAESGQQVAELKGHWAGVLSATYSPNGRHIVTTSEDYSARVWNAESGRVIAELLGHKGSVRLATYSPDGRRIATASWDKTARVWDAESGLPIAELTGHGSEVWSATYSPDGRRIATASSDNTARVWDLSPETWTPRQLEHFVSCQLPMKFDPTNKNILVINDPTPQYCQDAPDSR